MIGTAFRVDRDGNRHPIDPVPGARWELPDGEHIEYAAVVPERISATEPNDDQVHRYVQKLLQNKRNRDDRNLAFVNLQHVVSDIWKLRERDRLDYEKKLGEKIATEDEAAIVKRKMRDLGVEI